MKRAVGLFAGVSLLGILVLSVGAASGAAPSSEPELKDLRKFGRFASGGAQYSGVWDFRDVTFGTGITECPQAGLSRRDDENPLDRREKDAVEQLSDRGDDVRANTDYSCFPQNETSIAFNPTALDNLLATQNDYRTLSQQGFDASTDRGRSWYSAELPPPSVPDGDIFDASGDPVSVYDRAGVAYSSAINFNREDDENGITVQRSTNGGYTWTRPCVPFSGSPPEPATDDNVVCGAAGDPRQPGDGVVTYFPDPDQQLNGSAPFDDKEFMAAGPRPKAIDPVCFGPISKAPRACDPDVVGVDRLYVTWTRFEAGGNPFAGFTAKIMLSHSDDQGRSWSPPKDIGGSAPFCSPFSLENACDLNQFSVPTVHPVTGLLGIAWENFNSADENQYVFVRSEDGGATFEGPFFVTPIFDVNYPLSGVHRQDCTLRGQQDGRQVLTNSCFRVNAAGNVVVDKRGGKFADDFYLVMSDNRNGTLASSNTDVFFFKSTDGGMTWVGPTRVNTDGSNHPTNAAGESIRDCNRLETVDDCPSGVPAYGNDQWFPWLDISGRGVLAVGYHDRRLDTDSTAHEWPTSRAAPNGRPGNYLAWFWGSGCEVEESTEKAGKECVSKNAEVIEATDQCFRFVLNDEGEIIGIEPTTRECSNPPAAELPPGANDTSLPFRNGVVSDVPHNLDYSFRAGIFMGDYNAVAYPNLPGDRKHWDDDGRDGEGDDDRSGRSRNQAVGFWTDSRNGRSSGGPGGGAGSGPSQPGRNPACEQADVFLDFFNPLAENDGRRATEGMEKFLVTLCPSDAVDDRDGDDRNGDD